MLGAPCNPCCSQSGPGVCSQYLVVRLAENLPFTQLLGAQAGWSKPPSEAFFLLPATGQMNYWGNDDTLKTRCFYDATFTAAHHPCPYSYHSGWQYFLTVPQTQIRVSVLLSDVTDPPSGGQANASVFELSPCLGYVGSGAASQAFVQVPDIQAGSVAGVLDWWTYERWMSARDNVNDPSVPNDAAFVTIEDVLNPWDFTSTAQPSEYLITLSDCTLSDQRKNILEGAYSLPYPAVQAGFSGSSTYSIQVSPQLLSRGQILWGGFSLFWDPYFQGQSPLSIMSSLAIDETEYATGGAFLRRTIVGTTDYSSAGIKHATNLSSGYRSPPAGVFGGEYATLNIYESTERFPAPGFFPSSFTLAGTCKATVSYEP